MSKFKSTLERVPKFFRYLLTLAVIALISLLFPSNVRFKYEFEKGQRWQYEDLEAPFDFAIQKPQGEVSEEIEALEENFSPYYVQENSIRDKNLRSFPDLFNSRLEQVDDPQQFADVRRRPGKYIDYGRNFLARLYDRGIIKLNTAHQGKGPDFIVNLVRGNSTQRQTLGQLVNVEQARSMVTDSLPISGLKDSDFLYPVLEDLLEPNLIYNDSLTAAFRADLLSGVATTRGMVRKGELIILKGGIVTDEVHLKLLSLREQYEKQVTANKSRLSIFIGYFLLTSLIIGVFMLYLRTFNPEIHSRFPKLIFVFMWLLLYSYLVSVVERADELSAFLIPFCIVPIVIKTFYDVRLALFTHVVVVLIASFLSSLGYEFTFMHILAGIVVVLTDVDTRDWSRFFYSMLYIFLTYALAYLGLSLVEKGTLVDIDWSVYTWIFLNVFLTLLAYPLIPLLERVFGFTSSISLVELSDMNRPLLQKLAMEAPGTLQHSLQVANLAESAAREIKANQLLVKVAALYHDIGKSNNPDYFIENQSGNNPHEDLDPLESARMIIGHVTEGAEMARKARLPKVLIDFILTHHGTTRVEYFYRKYAETATDTELKEVNFRYPGPKPRTKEETILMLADSIEAACKSLKEPTAQAIDSLIDNIISGKISHGQLDESTMSFEELEKCKVVFRKVMKSVHHVRIEYPKEKKPANR